jgi:uncharacterized RDD family membrane protein YckC
MRDEMAGIGRRCAALFVDLIMLELAMWPLGLAIRELTPSAAVLRFLQFVIAVIYSAVFLGERGQTPGKIMASLRTLSVDGSLLNQRQALVRAVIKWGTIYVPLTVMAAMMPLPTNVQRIGTNAPLVAPEVPTLMPVIGFATVVLWFGLAVLTRRDPNGKAPHDRVADSLVIKVA